MDQRGIIATYIVASGRNGTLYLGMTSDLVSRVIQHKQGVFEGFSKRYGCKALVWYETFEFVTTAIKREKQLKKWPRAWKLRLIEEANPRWRDLADDLADFDL